LLSASRLILKQPTGWFAAGREFQQALQLLSDPAFKLYVWLCLNAERRTGRIVVDPDKLASVLGVERRWIDSGIAELHQRGVCRTDARQLEIEDRYWPYQKQRPLPAALTQDEFVRSVQALFIKPACVGSAFTAADERIAVKLYRRQIRVEAVRRAIWLGSARRYATMLNCETALPVTCLRYFALIVDEVTQPDVPASYWEHVRRRADQLERQWQQRCPASPPEGCPTSAELRPASPE
jgi:hypothetical protein